MKKRRQHEHEEHIDESWLIPYADLLTLLLALFIVLFASSSLSMEKFQQIMLSINSAFSGQDNMLIQPQDNPINIMELKKRDESLIEEVEDEELQEDARLQALIEKIEAYIKANGLEDSLTIYDEDKGVRITLNSGILFAPGSAQLNGSSLETLGDLADLIKDVNNPVSIEGHTDDVPIGKSQYSSNWELSAARALSVLYYFETSGIPSYRMQFTGFGEYRPLVSNNSQKNRQANRRVNIIILKNQ